MKYPSSWFTDTNWFDDMRKLLNVLKHCSHLLSSYLFPNYRHPLLPTTCHVSRWGSNPPTPLEMWAQCTKAPSPGGVTYQLVNTVISGLFKVLRNFTHLRKKGDLIDLNWIISPESYWIISYGYFCCALISLPVLFYSLVLVFLLLPLVAMGPLPFPVHHH